MRSKVRTRIVIPKDMTRESLDHTQFSIMDYIGISLRYWLSSISYLEEKEKRRMAEEQQKEIQQIEDVKAALLDSIYTNLVNQKNQEIILAINRSNKDYMEQVLSFSDFSPFNIEILKEDSDVLASFNGLPILLKVTKKTLGGD